MHADVRVQMMCVCVGVVVWILYAHKKAVGMNQELHMWKHFEQKLFPWDP